MKPKAHGKNRTPAGNDVQLPNLVRTLIISGYSIDAFERPVVGTFLLRVRKRDVLGAEAKMVLLFTKETSMALKDKLEKIAKQEDSTPIAISLGQVLKLPPQIRQYPLAQFYELLGGEILTDRIFNPHLKSIMDQLGHNQLPASFSGKPDDLLEAYCGECFQFLLECPVRRFGQERRFEPLPDGLALGREKLNIYFDAKAYQEQFHPTADDIRRFASYIDDFNARYGTYVGRISLFLVISGSFSTDAIAIKDKSNDLLARCGTSLIFMTAANLAEAVHLVRSCSQARPAINWRNILVPDIFQLSNLTKELGRLKKDAIIQ